MWIIFFQYNHRFLRCFSYMVAYFIIFVSFLISDLVAKTFKTDDVLDPGQCHTFVWKAKKPNSNVYAIFHELSIALIRFLKNITSCNSKICESFFFQENHRFLALFYVRMRIFQKLYHFWFFLIFGLGHENK